MRILFFFANQRRRWFEQRDRHSVEYFAGAWAALLKAEAAFQRMPLLNGHLVALKMQEELQNTQQELREARKQLKYAVPHILAAKQDTKNANRAAQHDRRRLALAQRALQRMQTVAGADEFEPEVRLRYLQELITSHLALLRQENPDVS